MFCPESGEPKPFGEVLGLNLLAGTTLAEPTPSPPCEPLSLEAFGKWFAKSAASEAVRAAFDAALSVPTDAAFCVRGRAPTAAEGRNFELLVAIDPGRPTLRV